MIAEKNQYIGSAYKRLQNISRDKQKQLEYEAREKALRDHNQMMKEAREDGWEAGEDGWEAGEKFGREAGEKIGRKAGEKIGRKAGREEMRETAYKGMVEVCCELGLSRMETAIKIAAKFGLTEKETEEKVNQYWNG